MTITLFPFLVFAGLGFVLSLTVHLLTGFGLELPPQSVYLESDTTVIWIPILLLNFMQLGHRHHYGWKASLSGCPRWMRFTAYGLLGYLILNFFLSAVPAPNIPHATLHFASGLWLTYYGLAFAILYSALHTASLPRQ